MAFSGIEPQREQVDEHVEDVLPQLRGVAHAGQRVVIGDEVEGLVALLERDVLPDRAEVVADVQGARRLNSRQDPHGRDHSLPAAGGRVYTLDDTWPEGQARMPGRRRHIRGPVNLPGETRASKPRQAVPLGPRRPASSGHWRLCARDATMVDSWQGGESGCRVTSGTDTDRANVSRSGQRDQDRDDCRARSSEKETPGDERDL